MNETFSHRVELLQGNRTIRRLMTQALETSGFEVCEASQDALADLLVVDVDSGLDAPEEHRNRYAEAMRPVLVCGLRSSRERFPDGAWLERPFSPEGFLAECQGLLGLGGEPSTADDEDEPWGLAEDSTPPTQRLTLEKVEELEAELGLEKGTLDAGFEDSFAEDAAYEEDSEAEFDLLLDDTNNLSANVADEFLEIDTSSSIVLDVDDLEDMQAAGRAPDNHASDDNCLQGGTLIGAVERESIAVDELEWSEPVDEAPPVLRRETLNQTMPDAPAVLAPKEVEEGAGSKAGLSPDLARDIDGVSHLLAEAWGRIGLAARPRDRANHIRSVLRTVFSQGQKAAADEIERIPGNFGFSGDLAAFGLEDLLHTVRNRELRGRLEISVGDEDFVLYLDGAALVDLENLSGNDDQRLLDILLAQGAVPQQVYEELEQTLSDELAAPVQMQLRQEHIVSEADIQRARQELAKELCRELLAPTGGSFAFMPVEEGDGQAWPVDRLSMSVEDLLEAVPPEASSAQGRNEVFFPQGLQVDDQLPQTVEVPDPDSEP